VGYAFACQKKGDPYSFDDIRDLRKGSLLRHMLLHGNECALVDLTRLSCIDDRLLFGTINFRMVQTIIVYATLPVISNVKAEIYIL
jgi:hypothetical protein